MKNFLLSALMAILCPWLTLNAQIVTTDPSPLQEDAENVVVYYHADRGNKGLMGLPASTGIYAHTGVCVKNAAGTAADWKYAPTWGNNDPKYKLEYVSDNLWKLNLGNIRSYYGVAADETVTRLAFVFRTADCKKEGKTDTNGDIFVNIVDSGFQLTLTSSTPSGVVNGSTGAVTFTAATTMNADISISVNGTQIASCSAAKSASGSYTFPSQGDYAVTATATDGTTTLTESLSFCYAGDSQPDASAATALPGAVRNADGSVTFCLPAPEKKSVLLVGSWNDYKVTSSQLMGYADRTSDGGSFRYFSTTLSGLPADTPLLYYYIVDGATAVGDPYARLVLVEDEDKYISPWVYPDLPKYPTDKAGGAPVAVFDDNFGDYEWTCTDFRRPDKDNLVIYELLLRDFTGTEGSSLGNGTVRGAIDQIPYLKGLGINAVELLPICEFNGNNSWGYNPNFYFAIDKAYGTAQDYKEFIDKCHAEGIAVILDMVFNQSDWLHPWYKMYPVGSNPFYNATAPHAYSVLNDWNQGYPLVKEQWKDVVQYWMREFRVDGFRFDLVKGLGDNDSYASASDAATNAYNSSRVANMKRLHDYMREVDETAYFINENLAGAKEENEMAADGDLNWANLNNAGCQYAMGYESDSSLERMWAIKDQRTAGSTVAYLESHDEQRLAYKQKQYGQMIVKNNSVVAARRLACAAAQMILVPGSHMSWQFSEMGNAQNTKDAGGGNNTSPKKVDWSLLKNPANASIAQSYRELIGLRLGSPELFAEDATYSMSCSAWNQRVISSKAANGKKFVCVINPSLTAPCTANVSAVLESSDDWQILSKSYETDPEYVPSSGTVTVPANSYVLIGTKNITSVEEIDGGRPAIFGSGNCIVVENSDNTVSVWSIDGRLMVKEGVAGYHRIQLPTGIYIVRTGSETRKIQL